MGKYKFTFQNIGGTTRVKLQSGEDLCHLAELDEKMWTVLSCPTKGLHIDEKTLDYIDTTGDERIHVNEVISAAQWLTSVVKNPDEILEGKNSITLDKINTETEAGKKLYKSASEILKNLGKTTDEISITDTADSLAIFAKTRFNGDGVITPSSVDTDEQRKLIEAIVTTTGGCPDRSGDVGINAEQIEAFFAALADYSAWQQNAVEAPFGSETDKAIDLYNALDAKIKDFFLRSKLAAFDANAAAALDVQVSRIEAISAENLTEKLEEIASYPIARINADSVIDLSATINPAWAQKRLIGEVNQPHRDHVKHDSGHPTKRAHTDVIPTSVLQKVLYPRFHEYLERPNKIGPNIHRVKRWKTTVRAPCVKWSQKGSYLGIRSIHIPSLEILHGVDVLDYQDRPDRNIDRLKRTFYVASILATVTGKVNHAFTRGFSLFVRGYFRTARKSFHSYVEGVKRMYKLSTRSIGQLLSLVHQANCLCMQSAGFY